MQALLKTNKYTILLLNFSLLFAAGHIMAPGGHGEPGLLPDVLRADYWVLRFGFAVLLAPLAETLVLQHWLIQGVRKYLPIHSDRLRWIAAMLLSAMVFALGHTHTLLYMFAAFFAGMLFAGIYCLFSVRGDMHPALAVFLIHFSNNLLNFLWDSSAYWF